MATRYGYQYAEELKKKGWEVIPCGVTEDGEEIYGDPRVKDPVTGEIYDPYAAREIQLEREKTLSQ